MGKYVKVWEGKQENETKPWCTEDAEGFSFDFSKFSMLHMNLILQWTPWRMWCVVWFSMSSASIFFFFFLVFVLPSPPCSFLTGNKGNLSESLLLHLKDFTHCSSRKTPLSPGAILQPRFLLVSLQRITSPSDGSWQFKGFFYLF